MARDIKKSEQLEFPSKDVMAYILTQCAEKNYFVNLTKLQKLLYCCYGAVLAAYGRRLTEEHPQAWQYGPVFPSTFTAFKNYQIFEGNDNGFSAICPENVLRLIDKVIDVYGKFKASQLSAWSHLEGSPWYQITRGGFNLQVEMDDAQIESYFKEHVLAKK